MPLVQGNQQFVFFNTVLGSSEAGRKLLEGPLTIEGIDSKEFAEALKLVTTEVQANGSANAAVMPMSILLILQKINQLYSLMVFGQQVD